MKRKNDFEFEFLTTKEAAKILRLSSRTLEAMRRNGKGPPFTRMGHDQNAKVVYGRNSIRAWLADKTHVKVVPTSRYRTMSTPNDEERLRPEGEDSWIDAFLAHGAKSRDE